MDRKRLQNFYESDGFRNTCIYRGGDLGAVHSPDFTRFKLWSPLADRVFLNLYRDGQTNQCTSVVMMRGEQGVWEYELPGGCHGIYYDFIVEADGQERRTADPYARACNCNGRRSMVVDLRRTDPDGWEEDRAPEETQEQIICEVHVKDFSNDPSCGIPAKWRGKYKAFTVNGTTLNHDGKHPTCLDYLKYLGITHVQLMPVFDFASVDESAGVDVEKKPYNWGYDPLNFNVPEGSYATDPFHGEVRIRELKELVMALHQNGIRVVMDVVYNHTYSRDSWFERTVPGYYYRYREDGAWSDGSACGNDFACEREMAADYILESVLYWAEEYHIDGFRFDLMGLLDTALMNRIRRALDERFGAGRILLYGEPWRAGFSSMRTGSIPCLKENLCFLDEEVGAFCDATRDAIKGHVFEKRRPGFVNGGTGLEPEILCAIRAWTDGPKKETTAADEPAAARKTENKRLCVREVETIEADEPTADWKTENKKQCMQKAETGKPDPEECCKMVRKKEETKFRVKSPAQTINYVSAHDNLTLWDKLMVTMRPEKSFLEYDREVVRANKMAAAICYTCQGRPFFLAGEEAARTKCGDENSYQSPPEINQLDWQRMYDYRELMEYYRGLIAFRKQMPGLYDKSAGAGKRIFGEMVLKPGCVSFYVDNGGHDRWDTLAIWYNSTQKEIEAVLLPGEWELLIDGDDSWRWADVQEKISGRKDDREERFRFGETAGQQETVCFEESGWGTEFLIDGAASRQEKRIRTAPVSVTVFGRRAKG